MRVPDAYLTGERTKACGFFALCPTERCACPHSFAFAGRVRSCRQGRTRQSAHASLRMSVQGLCRTGRAEQRRAKKFSLYEPQVHTEGLHAHKLAGKNVRGNWQGPGETLRNAKSSGLWRGEDQSLRLMRGPCSTGQRQARGRAGKAGKLLSVRALGRRTGGIKKTTCTRGAAAGSVEKRRASQELFRQELEGACTGGPMQFRAFWGL